MKRLQPVHPGDILLADFLVPVLSERLGVSDTVVLGIVRRELPVTDDMAWRLSKALGTSKELWLNLQTQYDREVTGDDSSEACP